MTDKRKVFGVYFSGTGNTEKVVKTISQNLAKSLEGDYKEIDFTPFGSRDEDLAFEKEDIVVLGVPTIAGRVPNLLLKFLNKIQGNGALVVAVVTFGNRNYDDSLRELTDILTDDGFQVIGGGAFVGEHSFSDILAKGRPDKEDLKLAVELAARVSQRISNGDLSVKIPGTPHEYRGYYQPQDRNGEAINILKVKPKTDMDKCTKCGLCVKICPLGSIDKDDVSNIPGTCMKCCGCIKKCPEKAKYFDDPGYIYHKEELEEMYARRGVSEIY